jgi:hypothetical protein
MSSRLASFGAALTGLAFLVFIAFAGTATAESMQPATPGDHVLLSWNDLGMHCMNQYHAKFSVLPPYNNVIAQLIRRGDATHLPEIVTSGHTVEYSFPGNTYSVGKTDFWTWSNALFGVTLPPDIGLTGKGLTGSLDPSGSSFSAFGIPITPFPDATPAVESPYQQALVIARDAGTHAEVARSTPVVPVSVELSCVASGCHSSEQQILDDHPAVAGFDPAAQPILCARCHADPALGSTGRPDAGYFSMRMHEQHKFMDERFTGTALCYKCHPGQAARCLRGGMATDHGLTCQNCHGSMDQVASSIDGGGRVPWVNEPRCADCHTAQYAEPPGQLFKVAAGHGGVMCEGCHNSTHADWPSSVAADNANVVALQGFAGSLSKCSVCHGVTPAGPGPHGLISNDVGPDLLSGARPMRVFPNPVRVACAIRFSDRAAAGRLLVFDGQGRTVRLLEARRDGATDWTARWDRNDGRGARVAPGVYFVRWESAQARAGTRVTVVD